MTALRVDTLDADGFLFRRELDDGRIVAVMPATFGRAVLGIGPATGGEFADVWDFPSRARAIAEARTWNPDEDPEPFGWHRHPGTKRYRPDGDPAREYVKKWNGRPSLGHQHRQPAETRKVVRCSIPCFESAYAADCRFHDGETVGPDTPLPPYREGCVCWIEVLGPAHQADTSAADERNEDR